MVNIQCFILQIYENSFDRQAEKSKTMSFLESSETNSYFCSRFQRSRSLSLSKGRFTKTKMQNKNSLHWGYLAGIISGITYGMNPLFGVPVINKGLDVNSLLFYRYGVATLLMLAYMLVAKRQISITWKQFGLMVILGVLFTGCSITLFEAYKYIPSGIATSILYVYPIMVALIMMFFGQFPSWKTWISIFAGVAGAILLSLKGGGGFIDWRGIALVVASGLCYTLFIVIVNLSEQVKAIPNLTLTFYCFLIGSVMLFALSGFGVHLNAVPDAVSWLNVLGLAILPTAIATITLAASSKAVGATKTSILGILEPLTAIGLSRGFHTQCRPRRRTDSVRDSVYDSN